MRTRSMLAALATVVLFVGSVGAQDTVPSVAETQLAAARAAETRGDLAGARQAYTEAAEAAPDDGTVLASASFGLAALSIAEEAGAPAWEEVYRLSARAVDRLLLGTMEGVVEGEDRHHGEAQSQTLGVAYFARAYAALMLGWRDQARTDLEYAKRQAPAELQPLIAQMETVVPASDCGFLAEYYRSELGTLVLDTGDPERLGRAYLEAADELRQCGAFEEAAHYYERALAKLPGLDAAAEGLRRARAFDRS